MAEALVELLTKTLALRPSEIRCTTPKRSKLPIGSKVLATLAQEVVGAPVFLCLVTKNAARSGFVRFEIETRWKSGKSIFPVLGVAAQPKLIPEVEGLIALRCDDRHDLAQLVREVARELGREPEPLEFVTAAIDSVLRVTAPEREPRNIARSGLPFLLGATVVLGMSAIYAGLNLLELPTANSSSLPITETPSPAPTTDLKPMRPPAPRSILRDATPAQPERTTPTFFRDQQRSTAGQDDVGAGVKVQMSPAPPQRGEEPPVSRALEMRLSQYPTNRPNVTGVAFANYPLCRGDVCGSIKGTVAYRGAPVKREILKRASDAYCAKKVMADETVRLSEDNRALANVLVRVKDAPPTAEVPIEPVVVDQEDCMYRPRVQGAVEGQKIQFKNSDQTMHNVHAISGTKTLFNAPQQPRAAPMSKETKAADVVKLECDVHPWMRGYVVYSKSPLFAVSKADGTFEIKNVPPGKYTVEAWHEAFGTQTAEVTVEGGKAADPELAFAGE